MEFATEYLANGGDIQTAKQKIYDSYTFPASAPVQKDLLFVASNWSSVGNEHARAMTRVRPSN